MSPTVRVLVVDDEALARQRLVDWVEATPGLVLIGECCDGKSAIKAINADALDLVFLDIRMPGCDGFDVLRNMDQSRTPLIIFQTAFSDHAVHAFEFQALDYLLKPLERERFDQAVQRAKEALHLQQAGEQQQQLTQLLHNLQRGNAYLERLFVKMNGKLEPVLITEVDWIGAAGNYIELHCGKKTYLVRTTLNAFSRELDPADFVRIHRSTIVRLDRICQLEPKGNGDFIVSLESGSKLILSRTYRGNLEARGPFA